MSLLLGAGNETITIYFVQDPSSNNKDMRKAFTACQEAKLKPSIISEEEVSDHLFNRLVIYVLEQFKGQVFQSLASKECLVVGPRCLYSCLKKKMPVPQNESPVFSLAMVGVVATASKMSKGLKEELANLIGYMGGSYADQLTMATTHLISDEGRSPKCEKAIELQIPIMCSSWVKAVWEASHTKDVVVTDAEFLKHRLAPFKGMFITCSNLPQSAKRKLQAVIESHGGVYMPSLEQNKTTILIIGEPEGKKFKHAQLWGIPCLKPSWINESAEKGAALSSKDHIVSGRPKCSTPTSELPSFMTNSEISVVPLPQETSNMEIDETNMSVASSCVFTRSLPKSKNLKSQDDPNMEYKKYIQEIDLSQISKAGPFLDGCKIYLSGFAQDELEKVKKVVNKGGGTFFSQISDRLTHIILGAFDVNDAKTFSELNPKPHIVRLEWLLASMKQKSAAPIELYIGIASSNIPPSSPLSHKGVDLLKSDVKSTSQIPRKLFVKAPTKFTSDTTPVDQSKDDALKLRAKEELENLRLQNESQREENRSKEKEETRAQEKDKEDDNRKNDTASTKSETVIELGPIFKGLTFVVHGDDADAVVDLIQSLKGKIYSKKFKGKVDYAIVPVMNPDKVNAKQKVTTLWVEDCYEQGSVVAVEYYHCPVVAPVESKPLTGNVVCISGFTGKERTFINLLATVLGAKVQDSFSRKDHPDKGVLKSTHLICLSPTGSKYAAAVKWGIPAVGKDWILSMIQSGEAVEVDSYSVNKENENKPEEKKSVNQNQSGEAKTTPSNQVLLEKDTFTTPVHPALKRVTENQTSIVKATPDLPGPRIKKLPSDDVFVCPDSPAINAQIEAVLTPSGKSKRESISLQNVSQNSLQKLGDENFSTPDNVNRRFSFTSCGKSPFHVDTPETPYGQIFMNDGEAPSPSTRKMWKKWIDNLPELYQGSPEVRSFRKRRPSTPLSVIMKQLWVKFGGAKIDGIDPETGDLLPEGPYKEWVHENEIIKIPSQASEIDKTQDDIELMSKRNINEESPQSRRNLFAEGMSEISPQSKSASEDNSGKPVQTVSKPDEGSKCRPSTSWGCSKRNIKECETDEMSVWDFGKPNLSPDTKKRKTSEEKEKEVEAMVIPETEELDEEKGAQKSRRVFVLTNVPKATRKKFEGIITSLGGEVSGLQCYDPESTHLIIDKPVRSEKLLCSIASGKWVLHLSYLTQCYQSRTFLPEEDFEWGNERSKDRLPHLEPGTENDLAKAAYRWRLQRSHLSKPSAFRNFKTVVCTAQGKVAQYQRILEAGGATVLDSSDILKATHVFWDEVTELPVSRAIITDKKILLVKPIFLGDYLTKIPQPNPKKYSIC